MKIAVLVGSLRQDSFNRQLARALEKALPEGVQFDWVDIHDLPLYDQDADSAPAPSVSRLRAQIAAADGVLFVTPEYNRSIPGVLKNAIDHGSRPWGQSAWAGKPAAVLGVSVGAAGTSMAQQHLRNVLAFLNMPTLGQPEMFIQMREGLFTPSGELGESSAEFGQKFIQTFVAWVARFKA